MRYGFHILTGNSFIIDKTRYEVCSPTALRTLLIFRSLLSQRPCSLAVIPKQNSCIHLHFDFQDDISIVKLSFYVRKGSFGLIVCENQISNLSETITAQNTGDTLLLFVHLEQVPKGYPFSNRIDPSATPVSSVCQRSGPKIPSR